MTDEQNSDADGRTEALENLAAHADDLVDVAFFFMLTVGVSASALIGYLEEPSVGWFVLPILPFSVLSGLWALVAVVNVGRWIAGRARQRWGGVQARNQSNTSDGDMDSKQVNLSEREESA